MDFSRSCSSYGLDFFQSSLRCYIRYFFKGFSPSFAHSIHTIFGHRLHRLYPVVQWRIYCLIKGFARLKRESNLYSKAYKILRRLTPLTTRLRSYNVKFLLKLPSTFLCKNITRYTWGSSCIYRIERGEDVGFDIRSVQRLFVKNISLTISGINYLRAYHTIHTRKMIIFRRSSQLIIVKVLI